MNRFPTHAEWLEMGLDNQWTMPKSAWWQRLPIIRHVRTYWEMYKVERWYAEGPGSIGIRTGRDEWVLVGFFHGWENGR